MPGLDPALLPPVLPDAQWTTDGVSQATQTLPAVREAVEAAHAAQPALWNGQCLAAGPSGIDAGFEAVARELQRKGYGAGQASNDANPKADHLYVRRVAEPTVWEQIHLFSYTDGCVTQNPFKGAWRNRTVAGCAAPQPPPLGGFVVHRRDIRDGWEKFDSTPVTSEGNRAYCDSVGFQNRNSCPARAEEPAWIGGDRLACERRMLRGPAPMWKWTGDERDGGVREDSNGFAFDHRKGSAGALTVCDALGEKCMVVLP